MGQWVHRLSEVDLDAMTAVCSNCGPVRVRHKGYRSDGKLALRCSIGVGQQKRAFPITLAEYEERLHAQGGTCALCPTVPTERNPLRADHSHETGEVRGLLCNGCNWQLGLLGDNYEALREHIVWVERSLIYLA